ncbi:MAG: acyl-CoA synthetase FdrA [Burkholderiales bacterium]|nr:acyl-CoA synthetase FdrA [Burkholderiales bacterium]
MPVVAAIKPGFYKDSVALMRVAQSIAGRRGIARATLVMGTPANKAVLEQAGLLEENLVAAQPGDLLIVVEGATQAEIDEALQDAERLLVTGDATVHAPGAGEIVSRSLAMALAGDAPATLAQISVPGPYAAAEALKALKRGLHVFLFSDNVPLEQEIALKRLAAARHLLVMGSDCGTAILGGVPLGFANAVRRGVIGLTGASGTGIQHVSTLIHQAGEGVSHAIGTGSRDVLAEVGAATMREAMALLAADRDTHVVVIVSKPPAKPVAEGVLADAARVGKPVVVLFLGASGPKSGRNLTVVSTLEDAATAAVALARGNAYQPSASVLDGTATLPAELTMLAPSQRYVRGLYAGGTFCTEAQVVLRSAGVIAWSNAPIDKAHRIPEHAPSVSHCMIDMGAGEFTVGRPHPMIDQSARAERLVAEARDPETALVMFDVVLGYGAHADPAGALAPAIREARATALRGGRHLILVAFACGTEEDPQRRSAQAKALREAGVNVVSTSTAAARLAASVVAARSVSVNP